MKDQEKRELGGEQRQEPLRSVHVTFDPAIDQMRPQIRNVFFYQPIKLVKPQMQRFKAILEGTDKHLITQVIKWTNDSYAIKFSFLTSLCSQVFCKSGSG